MNNDQKSDQEILFLFIERGDIESLKKFLRKYNDVNMIYLNNLSLLGKAVFQGQYEIVKYLVSIGSIIDSLNEISNNTIGTPFFIACLCGYKDIAHYLYLNGAEINYKSPDDTTPLFWAVWNGHLNIVKYLISELNYDINEPSFYGRSAIFVAIENDQYEIFKYLISNGADVNFIDHDQCTPLLYACHESKIRHTKMLVLCGANINATLFGHSALYYATKNNNLEMVKYLLSCGACFSNECIEFAIKWHYNEIAKFIIRYTSYIMYDTKTALDYALRYKNNDIMKFLIDNGMLYNQTLFYQNCYHYAIVHNSYEIIDFLQEEGYSINNAFLYPSTNEEEDDILDIDDEIQKNPIPVFVVVVMENRNEMAEFLLKKGANPNQKYNHGAPLYYAIQNHNYEMVKILIKYGAELDLNNLSKYITFYDEENSTFYEIIEYLIKSDTSFVKSILCTYYNFIQLIVVNPCQMNFLIQNGVDYSYYPITDGLINYELPISHNEHELKEIKQKFEILCQIGIGLYDSNEKPLLHYYIQDFDIFKYLVEKGVNIRSISRGKNIIHYIAKKGTIEMLKYALKFGIPFYKTDDKGRTPYDIAVSFKKYDIASFLDSLSIKSSK